MIRNLFYAAAIAGLFAVPAAPAAGDPGQGAVAAERSAAAAVDAFHAALRQGDTDAALALLVDDALIFEEGGAERSKAEYAASHLAADAAFSQAVTGEVVRRTARAGGDLAWIATESRSRGSFRGQPVNRLMVETMVLRRLGTSWKIAHIHWSSAEAPMQ